MKLRKKIDLKKWNSLFSKSKKNSDLRLIGFVAGGAGLVLLGRYLYQYYQKHPEFGEFIRENLNEAEEKFKELARSAIEKKESSPTH